MKGVEEKRVPERLSVLSQKLAQSLSDEGLPSGTQGELFIRTSFSRHVRFNNNELEGVSFSKNVSSTVRLMGHLNGRSRLSMAQSSRPGVSAIGEMVKDAGNALSFGTPVDYDFPGPSETEPIAIYSEEVESIPLKELSDLAQDLLDALRKHDQAIRVSSGAGYDVSEVFLVNTKGFIGTYKKSSFRLSLGGQLIQGDDFLRLGDFRSSWTKDINPEELKKEVIQHFEWARNVVPFEKGGYPVIFAPQQVGFLMTPFLACLNGKAFARDISPLKGKLNERLLDQRITLVDDGTLPKEVSSAPFDREGVPTRRNLLIDQGVPKGILLDLQTAKELGQESTGNGSGAGPAPHHVLLAPGELSLDQMIKNIDLGLIIFGSMGAWTGNPYSGNVSGTISMGLKIENGQIVGRVKNCMFSLNVFKHFKDELLGLSKETKRASGGGPGGGAATFPYVALNDVIISTR